ncbi:MAG: hypothetical protein AAFZ05_05135 [Pseudomonadota bacterium]
MTTSVRLPRELEARLKRKLRADNLTISDYLRALIEDDLSVDQDRPGRAYELGRDVFGKFGSETPDLASNDEATLKKRLKARAADGR